MDLNVLSQFSVKVNNGSGCLIQPLTDKYSYALTAKHVIEGKTKDKIQIVRQILDEEGTVKNQNIKIIDIFYHSDANKDAAILKIEFIPVLDKLSILPKNDLFNTINVNYLTGHPKLRKQKPYSFRQNPVTVFGRVAHNFIEIEVKDRGDFDEIDGQSGGGIINIFKEEFYLVGIQSKMAADNEQFGRCLMMPVSFFDEIIKQNLTELAHLDYPLERGFDVLPPNIGINSNTPIDTLNTYQQTNPANISVDFGLNYTIDNLKSELSKEVSKNLEELKEKFRQEYSFQIYEEVKLLRNSPNWGNYEVSLRGSILRTMAIMILALEHKEAVTEAEILANEAHGIESSFNQQALRGRIKIYKEGFEATIEDLENYHDTETLNLLLNCLLNTHQYLKVIEKANNIKEKIDPNAETHRLLALAYLGSKNIDNAQIEIQKSLIQKPLWQYVRLTAAMINYYSAISPNGLPQLLVAVPTPVFPDFVKIDDKSQENVQNAAQEFLRISQQYKENSKERQEIESWYFSCLAILFNKTDQAVEFGKKLLIINPGNLEVLSWFLFRDYDYDFSVSLRYLEDNEKDNENSLQGLITLVRLYLRSGKIDEALSIINKRKANEISHEEEELLRYWYSQTYLKAEQLVKAEEEATQIVKNELKALAQYNILTFKGENQSDWKPLINFLKNRYEDENDSNSFLTLFEIKAEKALDAKFIAKNAELYCDLMGTAGTVYMVADKLWKLRKFKKCLEILNKYNAWFPENKLPIYLRKIKVNCLMEVDIKAAVEEAKELNRTDSSLENLMLLMDAHLAKGDFKGFKSISKELLKHPDAKAENLLRAANIAKVQDSKLAIRFWTKANEIGIPDDPETIVFAKTLAFKLGLESESAPLMRRMMQNAKKGKGPVKLMSFRQLLRFMEQRNKFLVELDQKNRIGEAPLHILANQRNITLAEIFNLIGQKTKVSGDLHNRPRLLIRHGSKSFIPFSNFEQAKEWNLYLDISTLLLAQKLGILDQIETSFKQLKISPISVTALIKQRDDLNPDQQSERSSRILISQLYEEKKFKLYEEPISQESIDEIYRIVKNDQINSNSNSKVSNKKLRRLKKKRIIFADPEELERQLGDRLNLIASAYSTNGLSVLLKPIICYGTKDNSVLRLPELISNQIINCREICESLKAYNRISDDVYKKAISSLGQEANFNSQLSPLPKAKLYLMEAVAILLAKAGILKEVCETFEVFLSQKSVYSVTEAIKYYQECEELGKQLDELIERINDGIDEGIYQFTVVPDEASAKDKVFDEKAGLDFNSTLQLFLPEPEENDVICIDDRALNKYSNRSGKKFNIPIIGINELLICLWQNDFIDEHKYYDLLLELRKCNFRYIPITHDEIIFHLQRAPFEKGRIIENEALAVLRQYYCSCLLDTKFLQIYDNSPLTELTFVTNSIESVNNSISKVWDSETLNIDLATAQSNWIFENLFTGFIGCSHLRDEKLINNKLFDIKTLAYDISNLLIRGLLINDEKDPFEINENRQHYFKWINDHILLGNCVSEPAVLLEIGQEIKARLKTAQFQKYKTDQERVLAGFFTGRFYLDLPKIVTDIITLNEEAKNWLQIRLGNGIEVHDILFETHNYWKAVEKAIAGEEVRVKSLKSDTEYIFTLQNNNADHTDTEIFPLILISNQENKEVGSIQDATFALLKADPDKRLDALRKMRHWFDCSQTEFEETVNQINKIDDPLFRAQEHLKIREKSIELFYLKLAQRFEENKIDYWNELLPPSAESLSGYFRLPLRIEGNNFSDIYREAAETLLKEEKLQFVISRLSSLPVSMPKKVIQNLSELTALEKLQILENLSYGLTSPIQILHLINLALRTFTYEDDKEAELTRNLINLLYETNTNQNNIKAFTAILSSCKNDFKYWNESNKWSPEIFLAMLWAHSSRLHNILRLMGLTPDFITSFFYSKTPAYPEILNRNPETWNDCIYPNRINRTKLLTHAAAKLFDGIPLELLERFEIPNLIKNEVFQNEDGDDIPYALLSDPNLSQNSLSSFFGGDRFETLSPIIGGEKIEAFKTENLRSSVGIYLQSLINTPEDLKPWVMIYLIAEDLPIYLEWQKLLSKALRKFDPKALFQLDVANPSYLLLGATDQIPHLIKEDFRPIFRNHILEAATEIATITDKKQRSLTKSILMEAVFSLSFHPGKPTLSSEFFVSLLEEIENIWGDLSNNYRSFESDFIWNIPVDESKPWRLFDLKIRANRKLNKMY